MRFDIIIDHYWGLFSGEKAIYFQGFGKKVPLISKDLGRRFLGSKQTFCLLGSGGGGGGRLVEHGSGV